MKPTIRWSSSPWASPSWRCSCCADEPRPRPAALLAVVLLTTSKAFVDYSTSGLENPLAHLLLLLLWGLYVQAGEQSARRVWTLAFLGSLVAVTRLDLVLLVVPPFLHAAWCATRERRLLWWVRSTALGLMPLFLWELFSIIYYGFPFPEYGLCQAGQLRPIGGGADESGSLLRSGTP